MSALYFIPLALPDQDSAAWYRLDSDGELLECSPSTDSFNLALDFIRCKWPHRIAGGCLVLRTGTLLLQLRSL